MKLKLFEELVISIDLEKWHFFSGWVRISYFFDVTIQCHEIIEKSVVCYFWFDSTSLRYESHMFGKVHKCVAKITHVLEKSHMCGIYQSKKRLQSGWIKAHMCGKNHCQ